MKKLMFIFLFAAFGCATHRAPEPAQPQTEVRPTPPPADRTTVVHEERPSQAVAPQASSTREISNQPTESPAPAKYPEQRRELFEPSSRPASPVISAPEPAAEERHTAPLPLPPPADAVSPTPEVAYNKEILPAVPQQHIARTQREIPVPDHKLQQLSELAADNDERLMHVFVGMYRKTVDKIMGSERKPYRRKTINGSDGYIYEVIFYLTREPRQGRMINDRMLTPVIFKQGKVAAMGNYQLKKLNRTGTLDRTKLMTAAPQ